MPPPSQAALTDLTAEGQLIQAESFQFYIPADWETVELNDEEIAEGYVFAAASADGANSLIITYAAMDAAMTAEEAQPGLAEVYPTATVQDLNGHFRRRVPRRGGGCAGHRRDGYRRCGLLHLHVHPGFR